MSIDNPFGPKTNQKGPAKLVSDDIYETLNDRAKNVAGNSEIKEAVKFLKQRLGGQQIIQNDFARYEEVEIGLLDINVNIQRDAEISHIAKMIRDFNSIISQVVNVTYIKGTKRYSAWDGQQTAISLKILLDNGIIAPDVKIRCMVIDDDQLVPGSTLVGEGAANYSFTKLNTERKPIKHFYIYRSRVNGYDLYGSKEVENVRAWEIEKVIRSCNMCASPKIFTNAGQGEITHIDKIEELACFDKSEDAFKEGLKILRKVLTIHDKYFSSCKGVHVDFMHAMGDIFIKARELKFTITQQTLDNIYTLFKEKYKSPHGFSKDCKARHKKFVEKKNLQGAGIRNAYAAILAIDYAKRFNKTDLPLVTGVGLYAGI